MEEASRVRRSALVESAAIAILYAMLCALWFRGAGGFSIWFGLWQLLPAESLRDDLTLSLLDLHAQPPLLNLLLGMALKLHSWCGITPETTLGVLQVLLGLGAAQMLGVLGRRLVPRPLVRAVVLAIVLANPYYYAVFAGQFFYTPYEVVLLLAAAVAFHRWYERPTVGRVAAVLTPALALVHMRSLFHPMWFLGVAAIILLAARGTAAGHRTVTTALVITAVALCTLWPLKNFVRFGFFGFSSWAGYHAAQGLRLNDPVIALFRHTDARTPTPEVQSWALHAVPDRFRGQPTLTALTKSDGTPNWNHFLVIEASARLGQMARDRLRAQPWRLWDKLRVFYAQGLTRYEGRHSYSGRVEPPMAFVPRWARAYETVVYQPFRDFDPAHPARLGTDFAFLFPAMLAAPLVALWRTRRRWCADAWTVVLMMWSVLWVTAMVLLVDGYEGSRIRYSTSPLLLLCLAWALSRATPSSRPVSSRPAGSCRRRVLPAS